MNLCCTSFRVALGAILAATSGALACGSGSSPESPSAPGESTADGGDLPHAPGNWQTSEGGQAQEPRPQHDGGQAPLVTIFTLGGTGNLFDLNGAGAIPLGITPAGSTGGSAGSDGGVALTSVQVAEFDFVGDALITTTHDFDWVPIRYPASAFPMNVSVAEGVAALISAIDVLPVGHPFVLEGISQGAIVTSQVLKEIQRGSLTNRQGDLLAGVTFGNPCREQGHLWPTALDPGAYDNAAIPGHGILTLCELTGTPDLWWDFVDARDPATAVGDDDAGQMLTAVFGILYTNLLGPGSIGSLIQELFTNLGFDVGALPGIVNAVNELALFAGPDDPHAQYWSTAPQANPPTPLTSAQVAIDHLSGVAKSWRASH